MSRVRLRGRRRRPRAERGDRIPLVLLRLREERVGKDLLQREFARASAGRGDKHGHDAGKGAKPETGNGSACGCMGHGKGFRWLGG